MDVRHLNYFVAVAEELHFGRAADRLDVSVATLSHQIRALEAELGARLLNRKTKSAISLTDAGKRFLLEARIALQQFDKAALVGRRAGRGEVGTLALGYVMAAVTTGVLPSAMREFLTARPDVAFQLERLETFPQMDAIAQGRLDLGITRAMQRYPSGLTGFVFHTEPYVLAIPEGHRLARRKSIAPEELLGESLIAASLQMEVGFWGNLTSVSAPHGPLQIAARAHDMLSVIACAAAGLGISAVSESHARIAVPGLVYRPMRGDQRQSELAIVFRRGEANPLVKSFISVIRKGRR
jgi:DNA-binding transcriptional LysR family regulator